MANYQVSGSDRSAAALVQKRSGYSYNPLENRREHPIPEFDAHTAAGYKVPVNAGTAPGTSDDRRNHLSPVIQIKPSTGYGELIRVQFSGPVD